MDWIAVIEGVVGRCELRGEQLMFWLSLELREEWTPRQGMGSREGGRDGSPPEAS